MARNQKIGQTIPFLGREFKISIDVYLTARGPRLLGHQNMIHLTTAPGGNNLKLPAMFTSYGDRLCFQMQNIFYETERISSQKGFMTIEMSKKLADNKVKQAKAELWQTQYKSR